MNTKHSILLIDDDLDFVEATRAVLESVPYEVRVAYSGDQGLAMARENRPDLIILDVIMPGEDGFQTLQSLRADPLTGAIPVMMLTSLLNGLTLSSAGETRVAVEDYIDKPVRPAELLKRVAKLLGVHNASQAACNSSHPTFEVK